MEEEEASFALADEKGEEEIEEREEEDEEEDGIFVTSLFF